jgi:hypothetical protein
VVCGVESLQAGDSSEPRQIYWCIESYSPRDSLPLLESVADSYHTNRNTRMRFSLFRLAAALAILIAAAPRTCYAWTIGKTNQNFHPTDRASGSTSRRHLLDSIIKATVCVTAVGTGLTVLQPPSNALDMDAFVDSQVCLCDGVLLSSASRRCL